MDCTNRVTLSGSVKGELSYSHSVYSEAFYTCFLQVPRLSGTVDLLPLTVSERLLTNAVITDGAVITVSGQLRSYNKFFKGASRLILTVFAQEIAFGGEPVNTIILTGYLCKQPTYRVTPFSREITDLLLAVNRAYNKSDYIPAIAWGRNARFAGTLGIGDCISVTGRVQSREYKKQLPDGGEEIRTAYEVSIATLELIKPS
ncbi:MAG: single-stranded DNA-binding protein [Christensenellales bacterium]|jgi:primosomal replication protein N